MEERMKRIQCGDLVPGCEFKAQAASVAEVLSMELEHARQVHDINVTPQFLQRARDRIEDVDIRQASKSSREARPHG
jgi:predicted small metal-binding protein